MTVNGIKCNKLTNAWASVNSTEGSNIYAFDSFSNALELRPENMSEDLGITVTAKGYAPLTFTVKPASDKKTTPEFNSAEYVKPESSWDAAYYRVEFDAENDEELSKYLSDKTMAVTVNGEVYKRSSSLYSSSTKTFVADGETGAYGKTYSYLKLSADAFKEDAENKVEISVDGYEPFSFTIGKSDEIGDEDGDEFVPEVAETKYVESSLVANYYQITLKNGSDKEENQKIKDYLDCEDLSVTVNGETYERAAALLSLSDSKFIAETGTADSESDEHRIRLAENMFTKDINTIVIEAGDEFGSITVKIKKDGTLVAAATEAVIDEIEVPVDTELPAEDEIMASEDKKEEVSDDIHDDDETVADDKSDLEDSKEDSFDESKDEDSAEDSGEKDHESGDAADAADKSDDESEDKADRVTDQDDATDSNAADQDDEDADEGENSEEEKDSEDADESGMADAEDSEAEME